MDAMRGEEGERENGWQGEEEDDQEGEEEDVGGIAGGSLRMRQRNCSAILRRRTARKTQEAMRRIT